MAQHPVYGNIKALRELKRYSMAEMAEKLNISPSSYFQLEKGNSKATIERLEEIAEILEVSLAELLGIEIHPTEQLERIAKLEKENAEYRKLASDGMEAFRSIISIFKTSDKIETEEEKAKRLENFENAKELLKDFKL
ncbi:helix-turn-helix domain-containing protein [Emticicia soli]|uniref:Helix-turn-helix domain-containing protein n=1 Tax=Emticicia soli TaxID=2027878 RepID=A0ABW5JEL5_9BACT